MANASAPPAATYLPGDSSVLEGWGRLSFSLSVCLTLVHVSHIQTPSLPAPPLKQTLRPVPPSRPVCLLNHPNDEPATPPRKTICLSACPPSQRACASPPAPAASPAAAMRQLILTTIAAPAWGWGDKPPPSGTACDTEPGPQFGPVLTMWNFRTTRWVHKPSMPQPWCGLQQVTDPKNPCSARLAPAEPRDAWLGRRACAHCPDSLDPCSWHAVSWLMDSVWPASAQCLHVPGAHPAPPLTMTSMKDAPANRAEPVKKGARAKIDASPLPHPALLGSRLAGQMPPDPRSDYCVSSATIQKFCPRGLGATF